MTTHKSCETHCCVNHGCAYGYLDCPVKNRVIAQMYLCEDCGGFYDVARPKEIVVPAHIILKREDGTIANIPDEEEVIAEVRRFLADKTFNGWTIREVS